MRLIKSLFLLASILSVFVLPACAPLTAQYIYPLQNAAYVSQDATIILRYGPTLAAQDVASLIFRVNGSKSGPHSGQAILADDNQTVIFKPA